MAYEPGGFSSAGLGLDEDLAVADQYAAYPVGPFTASGQCYTGSGFLAGWSSRATTSAVAETGLYDGTSTGGQLIKELDVSQGFAVIAGPSFPGIRFRRGLYLTVIAGAPKLTLWIVPDAVRLG